MEIDANNDANEQFTTDLHDLIFDSIEEDADPMCVIGTLMVASFDLVQRGGGDTDDFVGLARHVAEVGEKHAMLEGIGALDDVMDALEEGDEELAKELLAEAFDADVEIVGMSADDGDDRDDTDMMFQ